MSALWAASGADMRGKNMKKSVRLLSIVTAVLILLMALAPCCFADDIPQSVLSVKSSVIKLVVDRWVYVDSYNKPHTEYGYISIVEFDSGDYAYTINSPENHKEGELAYVGSGFVVEKGEDFTRLITAAHLLSDETVEIYNHKGGGSYSRVGNCTIRPTRISCVIGDDVLVSIALDNTDNDETKYISNDCDFAILKFNKNIKRDPATIYAGDHLETGKTVYALGFPRDAETYGKQSYTAENVVVTAGNINKYSQQTLVQSGKEVDCYTVDARISGGNSGGPLVNERGEVIGINVQGTSDKSNNNSVDINEAIVVMEDLNIKYISSNKGLPGWAIALIVIGVIIFLLIAAVVIVVILIVAGKKKKKRKAALAGNPAPAPAGTPVPGYTPAAGGFADNAADNNQFAQADEGTTVLGGSDEGTTVLSPVENGGTLTRLSNNETIAINRSGFKVGKSAESDYCISDNTNVSRNHAEFVIRDGATFVVDGNSTNGTLVNGIKMYPGYEKELKDGDTVTFANEQFIYNK